MSELTRVTRITLANIPFDLQITICIFLRPIDILALRKTCKAFERATRRRAVWLAALHRVCLDNSLFLPSFPTLDMSDLELEQAALAPHRWIKLSDTFINKYPGDFGAILRPQTTRIIRNVAMRRPMPYLFLVPGGRYLVVAANKRLSVWDLGYVSNAHCTLVASKEVELMGGAHVESSCMVQATPDGKGLIILVNNISNFIYEIYPQSETPLLTQIAHLDLRMTPAHLLSDTSIFCDFRDDRIDFIFWDYRVNDLAYFSADVDVKKYNYILKTFATKTVIIVFCEEGVLVWAIPPLTPYYPDHFLDGNATILPPLFRIPYPHDIVYVNDWKTTSWYIGSLECIYFDTLCGEHNRFKLIVKPDLSDASLHVINFSRFSPFTFDSNVSFQSSRICEDTLVSFWSSPKDYTCGIFSGLASARFPCDVAVARDSHYLCPASGRFVYFKFGYGGESDGSLVVYNLT